jgi:hypothetical protein
VPALPVSQGFCHGAVPRSSMEMMSAVTSARYNPAMDALSRWLFPVPIRRSRFMACDAQWNPFNIQVALDRISPWEFSRREIQPVLYFDYQTQLDSNTMGRHGSGRGGIFRGYYVKGVGRTQAAGNWNDLVDRYHGSGHLSVASALRERLISVALDAQGLGGAIVSCESILLGRLRRDERLTAAGGASSSQSSMTPADGTLMALSLKSADFARMSNFVWALDHHCADEQVFGTLFLDLERYLNPPDRREGIQGEPRAIARAMDSAFRRGFANFLSFNRVGVFWIYMQNNFTLDGRFVDLETPLFFGAPFMGIFEQKWTRPLPYGFLGFENFYYILYWRLFLAWFKGKLRYLTGPGVQDLPAKQSFLLELARQIGAVFSPRHLLYADQRLQRQVAGELAVNLDLGKRARARLAKFALSCFHGAMTAREWPLPDLEWKELTAVPAPISATPFVLTCPGFVSPRIAPSGDAFAAALRRLGAEQDPKKLLSDLISEERALRRAAG